MFNNFFQIQGLNTPLCTFWLSKHKNIPPSFAKLIHLLGSFSFQLLKQDTTVREHRVTINLILPLADLSASTTVFYQTLWTF